MIFHHHTLYNVWFKSPKISLKNWRKIWLKKWKSAGLNQIKYLWTNSLDTVRKRKWFPSQDTCWKNFVCISQTLASCFRKLFSGVVWLFETQTKCKACYCCQETKRYFVTVCTLLTSANTLDLSTISAQVDSFLRKVWRHIWRFSEETQRPRRSRIPCEEGWRWE